MHPITRLLPTSHILSCCIVGWIPVIPSQLGFTLRCRSVRLTAIQYPRFGSLNTLFSCGPYQSSVGTCPNLNRVGWSLHGATSGHHVLGPFINCRLQLNFNIRSSVAI